MHGGRHAHISHHHHHAHGFMYALFAVFANPLKIVICLILIRALWNS